jgi:hypothetical protein
LEFVHFTPQDLSKKRSLGMKNVIAFCGLCFISLFFLMAVSGEARATCPDVKAAAWYVSDEDEIDDLEAKGFNLFFYMHSNWDGALNGSKRDWLEDDIIPHLDACSRLVVSINDHMDYTWAHPTHGMGPFMNYWGDQSEIYGFLLKDDVLTEPEGNLAGGTSCGDGACDNALWIYRWYYRMIKNDETNGYSHDISHGKPIIVSLGFDPIKFPGDCDPAQTITTENDYCNKLWAQNGHPFFGSAGEDFRFSIRGDYLRQDIYGWYYNWPGYDDGGLTSDDFLYPGNAWDIVMPYYYPHRRQLDSSPENNVEGYLMELMFDDMVDTDGLGTSDYGLFPASAVIPIIQTITEPVPDTEECTGERNDDPPNCTYFTLEGDTNSYDLSIQFNELSDEGLIQGNNTIVYYSANPHAISYNNPPEMCPSDLLHWEGSYDVSSSNIYYSNAGTLNRFFFCEGTDGEWDEDAYGDYVCGQAPGGSGTPPGGCDCGSDKNYEELRGCVTDPAC